MSQYVVLESGERKPRYRRELLLPKIQDFLFEQGQDIPDLSITLDDCKGLVLFEKALFVANFFLSKPALSEVWTLLLGYPVWNNSHLLEHTTMEKFITALEKHTRDRLGTQSSWDYYLLLYQKLPLNLRLFEINSGKGTYKLQNCSNIMNPEDFNQVETINCYIQEEENPLYWVRNYRVPNNIRAFLYFRLLKDVETIYIKEHTHLIEDGTYCFTFYDVDGEQRVTIDYEHPDHVPRVIPSFPIDREKTALAREFTAETRMELARKMTKAHTENSEKWEFQAERTFFGKKASSKYRFPYTNEESVVLGGTGVGKSVLIEEECFRFNLNKKSTYVGVVVNKNELIYNQHDKFIQLGLRAAAITGFYRREKYESQLEEKFLRNATSLDQFIGVTPTLDMAQSCCTFAILHGYEIPERSLPCLNRGGITKRRTDDEEEGKEVLSLCPYAMECGRMKPYRDMLDSNVWITTPFALLSSRLPQFFDPLRRTLLELFRDICDVTFYDEVDETMGIFDRHGAEEIRLTGVSESITSQLHYKFNHLITDKQEKLRNRHNELFSISLGRLNERVIRINSFLQNNTIYADTLTKKDFDLYKLINQLVNTFGKLGKKRLQDLHQLFIDYHSSSLTEDNQEGIQLENLHKLVIDSTMDAGEKSTLIKNFLNSLNMNKETVDGRRGIGKGDRKIDPYTAASYRLEFIINMVEFERHLRSIVGILPIIEGELRQLNVGDDLQKLLFLFGKKSDLYTYLPVPFVSKNLTYRITKNLEKRKYHLYVKRDFGSMRQLLTEGNKYLNRFRWEQNVNGTLTRKKGHKVVGLSATAYMPLGKEGVSPHFHVPMKNVHLIKNKEHAVLKKENLITMFRALVMDNDEFIANSGVSREKRKRNLEKMAISFIPYIKTELTYWEHLRDKKEKRKVMLVPTSYKDVEIIADTLFKQKTDLSIVYVTNTEEPLHPNHAIRSNELEDCAALEVDVLIVPLMVVARGYNILQEGEYSHRSYFGSICLFVRPYYIPDDFHNLNILLNNQVQQELSTIHKKGYSYGSFIKHMQAFTHKANHLLLSKFMAFHHLSAREKKELCAMVLVLVKQIVGRLQRGDTSARILIADSKFFMNNSDGSEDTEKISMVKIWEEILLDMGNNEIMDNLFGYFSEALFDIEDYDVEHRKILNCERERFLQGRSNSDN